MAAVGVTSALAGRRSPTISGSEPAAGPMLMPPLIGVLFTTPRGAAAVAGGAAAVPIIIHLLNRKRYVVVNWAAMRFLLAAQKKNVRRLKLQQWLPPHPPPHLP